MSGNESRQEDGCCPEDDPCGSKPESGEFKSIWCPVNKHNNVVEPRSPNDDPVECENLKLEFSGELNFIVGPSRLR